jgi:hypothetical protein
MTAAGETRATVSGDTRTTTRGRVEQGRAQWILLRAHTYVFFYLLIFTFFLGGASDGGRSTSRNGANTSAGAAGSRERGEAPGRPPAGMGEASGATTTVPREG